MSTRLATGGRLLNKDKAVQFTFNGKRLRGVAGDTLASALLANDQMLVGRSFKYHRPRGIVAAGAEEPNALVNLGADGKFEPNQRATTTELFDGLSRQPEPLAKPGIRCGGRSTSCRGSCLPGSTTRRSCIRGLCGSMSMNRSSVSLPVWGRRQKTATGQLRAFLRLLRCSDDRWRYRRPAGAQGGGAAGPRYC